MNMCEKKGGEQEDFKASHLSRVVTEMPLTDLEKVMATVGLERSISFD